MESFKSLKSKALYSHAGAGAVAPDGLVMVAKGIRTKREHA